MKTDSPTVVGVDARAAAEVPAGRGTVVRELLRGLARRDDDIRYRLYARRAWDEALDARFSWELIEAPDPAWHAMSAWAALRDDVFLSTNSYLTAWLLRPPSVVFVYDLVPWLPGAHAQRRATRIERATIRPAISRAGSLLCISEATRRDLIARFPGAAAKSAVAPLAADARFSVAPQSGRVADALERHGLGRSFVLTVGTLEPRKNLPRLIAAHAQLPAELRAASPLAIVGPRGWDMEATLEAAGAHGDDVRLLGHVDDDDLVALYSACTVFCYPSLYEGFGLPVLEAMAAGAPVITSDTSSMPEVGGDAAVYANPLETDSISQALARLLKDPPERARRSEAGRKRATTFSWDRFTDQTLTVTRGLVPGRVLG